MGTRTEVTDGCKQIRLILKKQKITQAEFGRRVGKDQRSVSRWVLGLSRPDDLARMRMHAEFAIDPMSWFTKRELRALGAAA